MSERSPLTITIPGKPGAKGRPRFVRATGRTYTPTETVNAEAYIRALAVHEGAQPVEGAVSLTMRAVFDVPKSWSRKRREAALLGEIKPTSRPDLDNIGKLVKDALNGVAFKDDAQVVSMHLEKAYGPQALTVVTIEEIAPC